MRFSKAKVKSFMNSLILVGKTGQCYTQSTITHSFLFAPTFYRYQIDLKYIQNVSLLVIKYWILEFCFQYMYSFLCRRVTDIRISKDIWNPYKEGAIRIFQESDYLVTTWYLLLKRYVASHVHNRFLYVPYISYRNTFNRRGWY